MEADATTVPPVEREKESPAQPRTTNVIDETISSVDAKEQTDSPAQKENGEKHETLKDEGTTPEVHVSAHQRNHNENSSKRVEEGRGWNDRDRDRPRHNNYPNKKFKSNNRSDLTSQEESSDPIAIRKQVEFYFSDSNLLTDKFLFTHVGGHENLPVPVDVIHSFKRMRRFQPRDAVISALKESSTLDIVEEDNAIKRKEPLPEGLVGKPMNEIQKVHEDSSMARSIYVKGFGKEEASTQFDIEAFFQTYGTTNSVRLRRAQDGTFKGSVFVEFDSEDKQKNFLTLEPAPKWKSKELLIKSKKQYCDDKVDDIKEGRVRPHSGDRSYRGGHRGRGDRGDRRGNANRDLDKQDDRDWRLRREQDAKEGFPDRKSGNDDKYDGEDRSGGKHRGYGKSGRGRGGRGRGKERNEERRGRDHHTHSSDGDNDSSRTIVPEETSDEIKAKPKEAAGNDVETSKDSPSVPSAPTAAPIASTPPTKDEAQTDIPSKKRARDDDGEVDADGPGSAKKVDVKDR